MFLLIRKLLICLSIELQALIDYLRRTFDHVRKILLPLFA